MNIKILLYMKFTKSFHSHEQPCLVYQLDNFRHFYGNDGETETREGI